MKSKTEILEEATSQVVLNYFNLKYPDANFKDSVSKVNECVADVTFIINNFMRISADIARQNAIDSTTAGER